MNAGVVHQVREVLDDSLEPKARVALFKQRLVAAASDDPTAQEEFVGALLHELGRDPAGGVQCLAACLPSAPLALGAQLRRGEPLAIALRGAGSSHASAVADLASMVLKAADAPEVASATAHGLWGGLARAEGVPSWSDLAPSPSRSAAIRLWSRRMRLGPPGASAVQVAHWLSDAHGPQTTDAKAEKAYRDEKAFLLETTRRLWNEQSTSVASRVEDVLMCLLSGWEATSNPSVEWYASVVAQPHSKSAWVCQLVSDLVEPTLAAASEFLAASGGRAALVYAWVALYTSLLSASFAGDATGSACVVLVLGLLSNICEMFSTSRCWLEYVALLVCVAVRLPSSDSSLAKDAGAIAAWSTFASKVLVEIPDVHPESPAARLLPTILLRVSESMSAGDSFGSLASAIRSRVKPFANEQSVGLLNLGNTCYLNSFLQALALSEGLVSRLFDFCTTTSSGSSTSSTVVARRALEVKMSLAQVLSRLCVARSSFGPRQLASLTPYGLSGQQQDATELARWLLGQLGDAEVPGSLIAQSFGGQLRTLVRCRACGHSQLKFDAFADLCLPVKLEDAQTQTTDETAVAEATAIEGEARNARNVKDDSEDLNVAQLLRHYLGEEGLSGYRCDNCGATGSSTRRCEVSRAPELLMIALSRFEFQGGYSKINKHISIGRQLELDVLMTEQQDADTNGMGHSDIVCYDLYAVITHIGSSPHSGHYICLGRYSDSMACKWHQYDDAVVKPLPEMSQVELDKQVNGTSTAYVLFYRRRLEASLLPAGGPADKRARCPPRFFAEAVLREVTPAHEDDSPHLAASSAAFPRPPPRNGGNATHLNGPHSDSPDSGMGGGGGWIC